MTKLQELGFNTTPDGYVVAQLDGDVGDGPQRTSFVHIALLMQDDKSNYMEALGALLGHWTNGHRQLVRDVNSQWNDPNDMSRDQLDPMHIMFGLYGTPIADRYWFKYPNADIGGPMTWGMNIRTFKSKLKYLLYPLVMICDLQNLIGSIVICLTFDKDSVDDDNHIARLSQSIKVMPTLVSYLARRIYAKYRPVSHGGSPGGSNILGALYWKNRITAGGNPEMAQTWTPVILKYFKS